VVAHKYEMMSKCEMIFIKHRQPTTNARQAHFFLSEPELPEFKNFQNKAGDESYEFVYLRRLLFYF